MESRRPGRALPTHDAARARIAAFLLAGLTATYAALSVWYFYQDFFQHLTAGTLTTMDRSGWLVSVDGAYLWTVLSPWRMAGASLTVALLGISAAALWYGRPRARTLALLTLWGVLLPQVFWYTEFAVDWHQGAHLGTILLTALAAVAVPSALLHAGERTLTDWNPAPGRTRLLALAVAVGWIGFAASEFLDHSYQLQSWAAYTGALAALALAALAVHGIFHMRAWSPWAGMGAAIGLAMIPLAATWSSYWSTGGYIDSIHCMTAGTDARVALSALLPVAVVWALGAPYLHGFVRRLRA